MSESTPPPAPVPAQPSAQDMTTRRACDQWIRDGFKAHKEDVETVRADIKAVADSLALYNSAFNSFMECTLNALPNKDPRAHLTDHERWALHEADKAKRQEEIAKLRLEVRNGIIKTVINVVLVAAAGIGLLGLQTQFGIWVNNVKSPAPEAQKSGASK